MVFGRSVSAKSLNGISHSDVADCAFTYSEGLLLWPAVVGSEWEKEVIT